MTSWRQKPPDRCRSRWHQQGPNSQIAWQSLLETCFKSFKLSWNGPNFSAFCIVFFNSWVTHVSCRCHSSTPYWTEASTTEFYDQIWTFLKCQNSRPESPWCPVDTASRQTLEFVRGCRPPPRSGRWSRGCKPGRHQNAAAPKATAGRLWWPVEVA